MEELAASFIDCDDAGLSAHDNAIKSRLWNANTRIESMLSLAQTVIEISHDDAEGKPNRDKLTTRLDALASVIDMISDPDRRSVDIIALVNASLKAVPDRLKNGRLQRLLQGGDLPIAAAPLMALMLSELITNAIQHGAWKTGARNPSGSVSIQSEVTDTASGRALRLYWIEDGGPPVSAVLGRGFGLLLGERLFPQITGGRSNLHNSEDGLSWTFEVPITVQDEELEFGGVGL